MIPSKPGKNRKSASPAGLRYVHDEDLSIRRVGNPRGFCYVNLRQRRLNDPRLRARIAKLSIPPAWKEVRICRYPHGHIQAVGRDVRGRKQYRYHERWSKHRNAGKFERMVDFGRTLPRIRQAVARDLRRKELCREKVLAAIVRLLELSAVRVGNEQYAKQNGSYGLTTLRNRHARVAGGTIRLRFRGKTGKEQEINISHPALARVVHKCQHLPGQRLFEYVDKRGIHSVGSEDVNDYLKGISGNDFTAKDFRTWKATTLATAVLTRCRNAEPKARSTNIRNAIDQVANHLGNTAAICRKSYVHPAILKCYLAHGFPTVKRLNPSRKRTALRAEERAVIKLLNPRPINPP